MKKIISALVILSLIIPTTLSYGIDNSYSSLGKGYIEGFLVEKDEDSITIEGYNGVKMQLNISHMADLYIDNRTVTLSDFKPGMEVYGELRRARIVYLEGYSTENLGYIPPGGRVRSGIVKGIDRNQITIGLANGKEETYYTLPSTLTLKQGKNVNLNTLYVGDRVNLYFNEAQTEVISRIEIQGDSIKVTALYRGKLSLADKLENVIVMNDIKVFKNGRWRDYEPSMKLEYPHETPIYIGGNKIQPADLEYYRGKDIYVATKDFFGKDRIEHMVIKNDYQATYSEKIEDINWYSDTLELSNNKNMSFNEGTIIVKSDRLVDKYAINKDYDAHIVGDGRLDHSMANVIYIYNEEINNSNIGQNYFYSGRLDEILQDTLTLRDYFILNENEWESYDDDKLLYYDDDTYIYDFEDDKDVTIEEFYSEDYAVDEDSDYTEDNNLKDWYGYLYTDGDRAAVVGLNKNMDSLLKQRTTIGVVQDEITEDPLVGPKVELRDVRDWSRHHEKWMLKTVSINLTLEDALIVKGDKKLNPEELKPGDRLYIVREGMKGKLVLVK